MTHNEAPYSATFKMFDRRGLQIQFTVRADDGDDHRRQLYAYIDQLTITGHTIDRPDAVAAGERVETVTGYVLGERSDGERCIYLYGEDHLTYKIATVWAEQVGRLPDAITLAGDPWPGSAPSREVAERRGVFVPVDPFEVGMVPTGKKTEKGYDIYRFDRVIGYTPSERDPDDPRTTVAPRANGATPRAAAAAPAGDAEFDDLPRARDAQRAEVGFRPRLQPGAGVDVRGDRDTRAGRFDGYDDSGRALVTVGGSQYAVDPSRVTARARNP